MQQALRVTLLTLSDVQQRGFTYIWANLAFIICSLPIITLPAAFGALMYTIHQAQTNPLGADTSTYLNFYKKHLWKALPWGASYALFFTINTLNLITYSNSSHAFSALRVFWLGANFAALTLLLLSWVFYFEMTTPTLLGATRNALVMMLHNPIFCFLLLIASLSIIMISLVLKPLFLLLTFSTLAALANTAVRTSLNTRTP